MAKYIGSVRFLMKNECEFWRIAIRPNITEVRDRDHATRPHNHVIFYDSTRLRVTYATFSRTSLESFCCITAISGQ